MTNDKFFNTDTDTAITESGGLADRMEAVLWVLAVLGNWTVIDRIYFTWDFLKTADREAAAS